jgi:TolA-binding protein
MRSLFVLCLSLCTAWLPAQESSDTIVKVDGSSLRGVTVTVFTLTSVKVTRSKEEVEIPPHQIVDIQWGGVPESFTSGLAAMARNEYELARQQFGEAATASDRPVVKAEARLLQGRAAVMAAAGDPAAAANASGAMRAWLSEFPDHWRVPEGMYLLGRALRLGQVHADAEATLKDLDNRAGSDGWGAIWNARAKYELALSLLEQGRAADARSSFQSAGGTADTALAAAGGQSAEMVAIKVNSKVGEGESLVFEKDYVRASDYFRTLAQNTDASLAAAGKAGLGEATFLVAVGANDAAGLRTAEIALAEACVLDTGAGDTAAKANYYLGRVVTALGERASQDWKNRATAYFNLVIRSYSTSRWVGPAKTELAK